MIGGAGNDTYIVDNAGDVVIENAGEGDDTVQSSINYTLGANVENLTITNLAISATGNELDNIITGNANNNIIDGATGADVMIGGAGNDTYIVDNAGDVVIENAGEGDDTVQSSINYTLGANVENLTITNLAISATGNELDNIIAGNSLDNILDGGVGADVMAGGTGNDTYIVDNAGDVVNEIAGEGVDTVQSSINYTLGANVENLTLTGLALAGTGNDFNNVITGNSLDNVIDGGTNADIMIGQLGNDTYIVDNAGDMIQENADEGIDTVQSSIDYILGNNLENLELRGSAVEGTGNELNNIITGNSLDNVIDGGTNADIMIGQLGNDTYIVDNAGDMVQENADEGIDTVQSSIDYTLSSNIENLILTGTVGINGTGNNLDNSITGNAGGNLINGGVGADTMTGGAGNDTYIVDNAGDMIQENADEGSDTVQSSIDYTLGSNLENLILTGSAISATGNELNNIITGNAGNNVMDGGIGADFMSGRAGNDTYIIDNEGDEVYEDAGEGTDTVNSSVNHTLSANVENLTLTGTAISGTGNNLNNIITGNASNNILDGGIGADVMTGGAGNDTYIVDNTGDVVIENAGEGIDIVNSSVSYTLGANLENITLTGSATSATGNALDNILTGNAADNILDGGAGVDTMAGGVGNDTYFIDTFSDVVTENAGEGSDTVNSSVSYSLKANFENLTLTGSALSGTGNELDNTIIGNAGNNVLDGKAGNDTLDGGGGIDMLIGGYGDDSYYIHNSSTTISEYSGQGIDTVYSYLDSTTLKANFENLTLLQRVIAEDYLTVGTVSMVVYGDPLDWSSELNYNQGQNTQDYDNDCGIVSVQNLLIQNGMYLTEQEVLDIAIANNRCGADGVTTNLDQRNLLQDFGYSANTIVGSQIAAVAGTTPGADATYIANLVKNKQGVIIGLDADVLHEATAGSVTADYSNHAVAVTGAAYNATTGVLEGFYICDSGRGLVADGKRFIDLNLFNRAFTQCIDEDIVYTTTLDKLQKDNLNASGNTLDNVITGNIGDNVLDGVGGIDTLIGGAGNDTYYVYSSNSIIIENAAEGITDKVYSNVNYTLSENIEYLTLTGTASTIGTGNSGDNVIFGNTGANTYYGGAGNDRFLEVYGGTSNDTMYGEAGNDELYAMAGNDVLVGGIGNDILRGGVGNETYNFSLLDGMDALKDDGGTDLAQFDSTVSGSNVAFYKDGNNLFVKYDDSSMITVENQFVTVNSIEKFQLNTGEFLTNAEINTIIQNMGAYTGGAISSIDQIWGNTELMAQQYETITWHA